MGWEEELIREVKTQVKGKVKTKDMKNIKMVDAVVTGIKGVILFDINGITYPSDFEINANKQTIWTSKGASVV